MRFDWYASSIPKADPMLVVETLRREFGGKVQEGRRRQGYAQMFEITDKSGNDTLCQVLLGAVNGRMDPHAVATGDRAPEFAELVRHHWPSHRVTRFDAAEDFDDPTAFDVLTDQMKKIGAENKVSGLWLRPDDPTEGSTYYLGAASSNVRARAYQKGYQVRKTLHPSLRSAISEDWARIECQVRPKKLGREYAATCSPADAWGFALWSSDLAKAALALDVPRYQGGWKPQTDDERVFDWLLLQYGPLLGRMHDELGDWPCVGLQIGDRLAELSKAARATPKG